MLGLKSSAVQGRPGAMASNPLLDWLPSIPQLCFWVTQLCFWVGAWLQKLRRPRASRRTGFQSILRLAPDPLLNFVSLVTQLCFWVGVLAKKLRLPRASERNGSQSIIRLASDPLLDWLPIHDSTLFFGDSTLLLGGCLG